MPKQGAVILFYTCYSSLSIHHRRGAPHTATHQISSNIADSDDNLAQSFRNTSLSVVTGSALFATGSASAGKRQVESLENSGLWGEDSRKSTTRNEKNTTRSEETDTAQHTFTSIKRAKTNKRARSLLTYTIYSHGPAETNI